ncbi:MAG: hypothetical protein GY801_38485 [bacterium]|nr:hypothetical protein [bacterium]
MKEHFVYRDGNTKEISFPLGGIGTGCIGLAGNGRLIDWEIFNKPNKGSSNGFSHIAIKAEAHGEVLDTRVLQSDLQPPYTGDFNKPHFQGFGFGPPRTTLAGMPHFRDVEFQGEFPVATLRFHDNTFPGAIEMRGFNPFIPLNGDDSSIPGAFFEILVENTQQQPIQYTVVFSVSNPLPIGTAINTCRQDGAIHLIHLASNLSEAGDPNSGDMCVATDAEDVSYQEYWFRGRWFDNLGVFWRDLTAPGRLNNRRYTVIQSTSHRQAYGMEDVCSLAAHVLLNPGEQRTIRFLVTWNFPNDYNYWNPETCGCGESECAPKNPTTWKNYYATLFEDSTASAIYSLNTWQRLSTETQAFKDALLASTLPVEALDAVMANISILKTPTCLRLEDGSFYGFEGCHPDSGCCEGSCTHVWNYAYALPFLFPQLERSMRDLDFRYNQREDGGMVFRLMLPLGRERWRFRPCADGQFGGVIKTYREWKISGNTEWLKSHWNAIKKCIAFAWAESNEDQWDADQDGVLEGRQHHTLDMELFGPNSWLTGFYLAALKAGAEMADVLGDQATAVHYRELFRKGKQWVDTHLFNGEYYHQIVDLTDKSLLEKYNAGVSLYGDQTIEAYWNEEVGEMKYQVGDGCGIDQVIAQWHANLCGLGEIFDPRQTYKALQSLYANNFKTSMRNFYNPCRLYCLNDEGGLVICSWPEDKYKPMVPLPYAEETQNGYEYQAAIHMIQEGLVAEGLAVIKAIRDRYDGEKRNPWNEFECGSNYARSMASYALLPTFSGFEFDMTNGLIGFTPLTTSDNFSSFWCLHTGWGRIQMTNTSFHLSIEYGQLQLQRFSSGMFQSHAVQSVTLQGQEIPFTQEERCLHFHSVVEVHKGETLCLTYQ